MSCTRSSPTTSTYVYVWLRLLLKEAYPQSFAGELVDDSREAVHNDDRSRSGDFYATVVGDVFRESARTLKSGGRLVFSFHHSGVDAWRALENALVRGGFVVERWWPVFAEMESGVPLRGKDNNGHLDIVFVCGKADEITSAIPSEPPAEIGARLAQVVDLVPADYRALLQTSAVQRATWEKCRSGSALEPPSSPLAARGVPSTSPGRRLVDGDLQPTRSSKAMSAGIPLSERPRG
ncbi:MAG: hypothetical protein ABSB24_15970 [Gaiellaceae bacterium]